jgi:hypothetical protein
MSRLFYLGGAYGDRRCWKSFNVLFWGWLVGNNIGSLKPSITKAATINGISEGHWRKKPRQWLLIQFVADIGNVVT